jgi:hypothetical protein
MPAGVEYGLVRSHGRIDIHSFRAERGGVNTYHCIERAKPKPKRFLFFSEDCTVYTLSFHPFQISVPWNPSFGSITTK